MQIAQIAPLTEAIPPKLYGGTERVISWLADELVALGHDVVLFASGDSQTSANLEPCWPKALRLDGSVRDPNALHIAMLERVRQRAEDGLTGFIVERKEEAVPPTNYLGSLAVPSGGASRRGLRHGGWRTNILPSIAASWINDVPDGARTALENFWRRVLRATLLIKPRSKSPAEAGLKGLSMERLRANGISSPLTLCRRLAGDC